MHGFVTVAALGETRFGPTADHAKIDFRVVGPTRGQPDNQALEALGAPAAEMVHEFRDRGIGRVAVFAG